MEQYLLLILKILVATSIFFVWVIRYDNIIIEFKNYNYPDWLRDLVGILKLSFGLMLILDDRLIILTGATGLVFLMLAAVGTHIKVKNNLNHALPAISQIFMNGLIFYLTY
ncbi:MAG: DoxX family protein [Candidatus Marinimicrobia bacterium]|nr:DoxX family protein [Candidatus Neomarinimicrobiota bacterium]